MRLLLVGGGSATQAWLEGILAEPPAEGWRLSSAASFFQARPLILRGEAQLILWDLSGLGEAGLVGLAQARQEFPALALVAILGRAQEPLADQALELGAQDALEREGPSGAELLRSLRRAQTRQRMSEALRQGEERYRSIVESQTELICRFSPEGELTYANEAFRNYFPWARADIPGQNLLARMPAAARQRMMAHLESLSPESPLARIEKRYASPNGDQRWQQWTNRAFFDRQGHLLEYQSVGQDITERKVMQQTLQSVEANLRSLFVSNADGMIVVDQGGKICFVNPAAEQLLGRRAHQLVGSAFDFAISAGELPELHLTRPPDEKVVVQMRVVPTKWQGQPALLASLRDITELANLREELRALSLVDELTGLYNRRGFMTLGEQLIKTAHRMGRALRLFFMDLDELKLINDGLGHREGDRAILATAQVLRATFRESDILARVGGDEFVALIMEPDEEIEEALLTRLEDNLRAHRLKENLLFSLSLSTGAAQYDPAEPRSLDELIYGADVQMYENKRRRQRQPR